MRMILTTIAIVLITVSAGKAQYTEKRNNLALHKPVEASSAKWEYVKERAVDGEQFQASRWVSDFPLEHTHLNTQWYIIDLQKEETVNKARILWQRQRWATDYQIHVSTDKTNWDTVYSVTNEREKGFVHEIYFKPEVARYVRFYLTKTAYVTKLKNGVVKNINTYSPIELELYAPQHQFDPYQYSSQATGKPAVASHWDESMYHRPININDGLMTSFWSVSNTIQEPKWVYIDMQEKATIKSLVLYWHMTPRIYEIHISNDAISWTKVCVKEDFSVEHITDEEVKQIHRYTPKTNIEGQFVKVLIKSESEDTVKYKSCALQEILIK